ncbi:hypothetical protein BDR06DRAFT_786323 [Suillus hirtellus]|nr:hypothetical protein BDR06DRAFT_786323 [Suillus hirtellus]
MSAMRRHPTKPFTSQLVSTHRAHRSRRSPPPYTPSYCLPCAFVILFAGLHQRRSPLTAFFNIVILFACLHQCRPPIYFMARKLSRRDPNFSGLISFYDTALVPSLVPCRVGLERWDHSNDLTQGSLASVKSISITTFNTRAFFLITTYSS